MGTVQSSLVKKTFAPFTFPKAGLLIIISFNIGIGLWISPIVDFQIIFVYTDNIDFRIQ